MRPLLCFSLLMVTTAAAFPLASTSPSRLIWIRCAAEADCHKHPVCHLRCEGTVNGRQRASFVPGRYRVFGTEAPRRGFATSGSWCKAQQTKKTMACE